MTVSGELCCVALPFCCVVVALPFSASLAMIVHVTRPSLMELGEGVPGLCGTYKGGAGLLPLTH